MRRLLAMVIVVLACGARVQAQRRDLELASKAYAEDRAEEAALLNLLDDADSTVLRAHPRSVGSPHAGSLIGAVQLPNHVGYVVREPSRAWGTPTAINWLVRAFDHVVGADPGAPRVRVHDLSRRQGGPMDGHRSHQTGRDADITYYQHACPGVCTGRHVAPSDLDAVRQWRLLRQWLEREQVEFIFIDYALQRPLYEAARANGASARQLAQWFQFPRGIEFPAGIIRHVANHANHVHVRFRCAPADRACVPTPTRRLRSAAGESALPLMALDEENEGEDLLELLGP